MDIKWRNSIKFIVWTAILAIGISGTLSIVSKGSEYIKKDYFHSPEFDVEMDQFIGLLSIYELHDKTKVELRNNITVIDEEIEEHRYRYGNLSEQVSTIKNQYEPQIQDALAANNEEVANLYKAERDEKIKDITNNFKSDEHIRKKIVKEEEEKIDRFFQEREDYDSQFQEYERAIKYYLQNTETGEVFTNLNGVEDGSVKEIMNDKEMLFIQNYSDSKNGYLSTEASYPYIGEGYDDIIALLYKGETQTFEGAIAIPKSTSSEHPLMIRYHDYQKAQITFYVYAGIGLLCLVLSILMYKKIKPFQLVKSLEWDGIYQRIPIDLRLIAYVASFIVMVALAFQVLNSEIYYDNLYSYIYDLLEWVLPASMIAMAGTLLQFYLLLAVLKETSSFKEEWRKALIYKGYFILKRAFLNTSVGVQLLILLMVVFLSGIGAGITFMDPGVILFYLFLFLVVTLPVLIFFIIRTGYFNTIIQNASALANGNFEPDLPVKGQSVLARLAESINTLKHGVKASEKAQAKSERLKTELITNVSHDLRTPLTSIISYTELLKSPDLADEDRDAYVQVIDRKSKRLKVLIDDLFEASKMASGNIELAKDHVDIVQLLQQALAEYDETIQGSTLQFRVAVPEKPVYAYVDGQKLWRVFDNLIGNILKYSLEHTRVYIDLIKEQSHVVITFKNVSKYELGGNTDELFERFKRGDTSRHTDGSGLGLAIAKSIVDLHDGSMDIDLDGDLFKVTIGLATI
ncbi:HAMP domain-containing sensor histidine kinase [Bacillus sp. CECT 9360]|uniref:sensor histidine kinase n=1 Tax=Bacillus sp. CECT 9360 TaxID=2845821 RepID=UPI001E3BEECA|nr:HAMP domain-containing sensor histidine kinase [Bacillus sp. CECT 9360]CAH0344942.1 Adaptive-response sensory-kinase SasA [Bacillus sp. CECT 9360]